VHYGSSNRDACGFISVIMSDEQFRQHGRERKIGGM
jgi:hypothetical protein